MTVVDAEWHAVLKLTREGFDQSRQSSYAQCKLLHVLEGAVDLRLLLDNAGTRIRPAGSTCTT